ncbi:non-ribosomal peptide synthetase, partial [Pelomyxa schiedti]
MSGGYEYVGFSLGESLSSSPSRSHTARQFDELSAKVRAIVSSGAAALPQTVLWEYFACLVKCLLQVSDDYDNHVEEEGWWSEESGDARQHSLVSLGFNSAMFMAMSKYLDRDLGVSVSVSYLMRRETVGSVFCGLLQLLQEPTPKRPPALQQAQLQGQADLPLSYPQQRLWFLDQLTPGAVQYTSFMVVKLEGTIDISALRSAFLSVIEKNGALRTVFHAGSNGIPHQVLTELNAKATEDIIVVEQVSTRFSLECNTVIKSKIEGELRKPFDLSKGPLMRVRIYKCGEHITLLVRIHNIVSDPWSFHLIMRDVVMFYNSCVLTDNGPPSITSQPLPLQYADFTRWQREWSEGDSFDSQLDYWKSEVIGIPDVIELPLDVPRNMVLLHRYATHKSLVKGEGEDRVVVVGVPVGNRRNLLSADDNKDFSVAVQQVKEKVHQALEMQEIPFVLLVEHLQVERNMDREPLVQVLFSWSDFHTSRAFSSMKGVKSVVQDHGPYNPFTTFDLTLAAWPADDTSALTGCQVGDVCLKFEYTKDIFNDSTIAMLAKNMETLANAVVDYPDRSVRNLPLLCSEEIQRQLIEWNNTGDMEALRFGEGQFKPIHVLFEEQVARTPNAPAIFNDNISFTYNELNQISNQLAHFLHSAGIGPNSFVPVISDRSIEMVIAVYGIMKAGGAYVPLDPDSAPDRLASSLSDIGASIVILSSHLMLMKLEAALGASALSQLTILSLDSEGKGVWGNESPECLSNLTVSVTGKTASYAIFTSGSTGRPKAAINMHEGTTNYILCLRNKFKISHIDRVCSQTPLFFDASLLEFMLPLIVGACVVLAPVEAPRDPEKLASFVQQQRITAIQFVPSLMDQFLLVPDVARQCRSLRVVISNAEALMLDTVRTFHSLFKSSAQLFNLY